MRLVLLSLLLGFCLNTQADTAKFVFHGEKPNPSDQVFLEESFSYVDHDRGPLHIKMVDLNHDSVREYAVVFPTGLVVLVLAEKSRWGRITELAQLSFPKKPVDFPTVFKQIPGLSADSEGLFLTTPTGCGAFTWDGAGFDATVTQCEGGAPAYLVERARCSVDGGKLKNRAIRGKIYCLKPRPDAGKLCTDSSQCLGGCVYSASTPDVEGGLTGNCASDNEFADCRGYIINGRIVHSPCF